MMDLRGPNYEIDAVMPNSLRNSLPGYAPTPNDRIRIYAIVSSVAFTLTDGTTTALQLDAMAAAGEHTFNPPIETFDFKVTSFTQPGQMTIYTK